jgi:hypothetical protein
VCLAIASGTLFLPVVLTLFILFGGLHRSFYLSTNIFFKNWSGHNIFKSPKKQRNKIKKKGILKKKEKRSFSL